MSEKVPLKVDKENAVQKQAFKFKTKKIFKK